MIKKYSIYLAIIAAIIVGIAGFYSNITIQNLILRTVGVFFIFYLLGNILGIITIEALLDSNTEKLNNNKKVPPDSHNLLSKNKNES